MNLSSPQFLSASPGLGLGRTLGCSVNRADTVLPCKAESSREASQARGLGGPLILRVAQPV